MQCFVLREKARPGLTVQTDEEKQLFICIGEGTSTTRVPLRRTFRDEMSKLISGLGSMIEVSKPPLLARADISGEPSELVQLTQAKSSGGRDMRALIHVQTCAGERGNLIYLSAEYQFYVENGYVRRWHMDFPPPGIKVWAIGQKPSGEVEALLEMLPGAAFKLVRTGNLGDAPTTISVTWTGNGHLMVRSPNRYTKAA